MSQSLRIIKNASREWTDRNGHVEWEGETVGRLWCTGEVGLRSDGVVFGALTGERAFVIWTTPVVLRRRYHELLVVTNDWSDSDTRMDRRIDGEGWG